ncbi:MAG: aspartate aminotransferase family protein, partial [Thermoanaerobaculia bacterium]|nr:aspartate aminotransferase family protein [Thermoanaerobaculia bacterium]
MDGGDGLRSGDQLPRMVTAPPGPRARELCRDLERFEAPGINTLAGGGTTILWQEALGANVLDVDGNIYVDLTAGFGAAAVGHRDPAVLEAVRRQAARLVHGLGDVHAHPARVDLARRLAARAPVDDPRVYFAVSGADAVETALKTALRATGRPGIVAFDPAYHGLTLGALAVSSRPAFRDSFREHLHRHVRRLPFACPPESLDRELAAGAGGIGAVILEPIVGREGVLVPPAGWLTAVAELCARHRALLIADEILTGFGRTGGWFAVESEGVRPDLLCCGKALGGGLPVAAVIGRGELMAAWRTAGEALHTATFTAHPLSCAAALATLDRLEELRLPARARRLGRRVAQRLAGLRGAPGVVDVRGRGL